MSRAVVGGVILVVFLIVGATLWVVFERPPEQTEGERIQQQANSSALLGETDYQMILDWDCTTEGDCFAVVDIHHAICRLWTAERPYHPSGMSCEDPNMLELLERDKVLRP